MRKQNQKRDDLTQIKGIGAVRQEWLGTALKVFTFNDLAALSADGIAKKIKAEGKVASHKEIVSWIDQAQRLASSTSVADQIEPVQNETSNSQVVGLAEAKERNSLSSETAVWKPAASFVVEFQTRVVDGLTIERRTAVHHMEVDVGNSWPDIEQEQLCAWMAEQANIPQIVDVEESIVPSTEVKLEKSVLTATQILLSQSSDYSAKIDVLDGKRPFLGHVSHDKPIDLEVIFEQSGAKHPQNFVTQCRVHNLLKSKSNQLLNMETVAVIGEKLSYNAMLTNFKLEPGIYDLEILVSGDSPLSANYFELPKLNVL